MDNFEKCNRLSLCRMIMVMETDKVIIVIKHNLNKRPSFILTCQTTNSKCKRDRSCKRMFHLAHSHCLMLAAEKDKSGFPKREKPAAYTSSFNAHRHGRGETTQGSQSRQGW